MNFHRHQNRPRRHTAYQEFGYKGLQRLILRAESSRTFSLRPQEFLARRWHAICVLPNLKDLVEYAPTRHDLFKALLDPIRLDPSSETVVQPF